MGYRRRAGGGKRDAIERTIISGLASIGVQSWQIGGTGNPDLLLRILTIRGNRWQPVEIKSVDGRPTRNQLDRDWPVVRSLTEAYDVVQRVKKGP